MKVTEKALAARLNRKLAKEGRFLKHNSAPGYLGFGEWYLIDWGKSEIVCDDVKVAELAALYHVIKDEEEIA